MTDQNELEDLLRSSSSQQSNQYEGDFEAQQSESTVRQSKRITEKISKKKEKEEKQQSLEDFELIDEQDNIPKRASAPAKTDRNSGKQTKTKSMSKTSNVESLRQGINSKGYPNFSKNKNKTELAVPVKMQQILTLEDVEDQSIASPVKSSKIVSQSIQQLEQPEQLEEMIGESVYEDIANDAITENVDQSIPREQVNNLQSSEEVFSEVVESKQISRSRMTESNRNRMDDSTELKMFTKQSVGKSQFKPTSNIPKVISLGQIKENAQKPTRTNPLTDSKQEVKPLPKPDEKKNSKTNKPSPDTIPNKQPVGVIFKEPTAPIVKVPQKPKQDMNKTTDIKAAKARKSVDKTKAIEIVKTETGGASMTGLSQQQLNKRKEQLKQQKQQQEKKKELDAINQKQRRLKEREEVRRKIEQHEKAKEQKRRQKLQELAKKSGMVDDENDFKVEVDAGDNANAPDFDEVLTPPQSQRDTKNLPQSRKEIKDKAAAVGPGRTTKSIVSKASAVSKAYEASGRLKDNNQKKKQFDREIQKELKEKLSRLNKQPQPTKPQAAKQLRKKIKEDQLNHLKREQIQEKKDSNSTEIMHLKDRLNKLRTQRKRLKQRIIEQQEIHNRLNNKLMLEQKEQNVLIVDKNRKEYTSYGLVGDLKRITKTLKAEQIQSKKEIRGSDESAVEKFVAYFESEGYEQNEIFNCLDVNGDGMLTNKQIRDICTRLNIKNMHTQDIEQLIRSIDYNSDGSITKDEFDFVVSSELEKKYEMNRILGAIKVDNPIEIEERILDMKARIKYMGQIIEASGQSTDQQGNEHVDPKYERLLAKLHALQEKVERRRLATTNKGTAVPIKIQRERLTEQLHSIEVEAAGNERLYNLISKQIESNIKEKTESLKDRVEEQLKCREILYQLQNELHEKELRFITYDKIYDSKRRYVQQGKVQERQRQQRLKQTLEYKAGILNQKTKTELNTKLQQMTLISAVLMIQRNYRKKKAMRQYQAKLQKNALSK